MIVSVLIFLLSIAGILYELLIAALSSYLFGDSVFQYSITIGLFLFSFGVGAYLSKYLQKIDTFILLQLLLGLFGGLSATILYSYHLFFEESEFLFLSSIIAIGAVVGTEVPFFIKYFKISNVGSFLFYDYSGALAGSLAFVFFLLPVLGIFKAALVAGFLNLIAAFFLNVISGNNKVFNGVLLLAMITLTVFSSKSKDIESYLEQQFYEDKIIARKQSKYQKIVLTKNKYEINLYLNGQLQFSSQDEYRYHEALIHPGLSSLTNPKKVIVLGGGDGLALREILKYSQIQEVTLVDIDPEIIKLSSTNKFMQELNNNSFNDPKVKVINEDAFRFIRNDISQYDFIVIDLPDPDNESLNRFYTKEFYKILRHKLTPNGAAVTQATSPYLSKKSYWCIFNTIQGTGFYALPYHADIPSMGDWGFVLFFNNKVAAQNAMHNINIKVATKFLNDKILQTIFTFPKDSSPVITSANTLIKPVLLNYYASSTYFTR